MAERRTLTIESNYCANWTVKDAIREIIQNGLDTGKELSINPCLDADVKEKWVVTDGGCGLKLSDFIIGKSSKRNDSNTIGQFGEGVKIGCLVLAREDRQVSIVSLGKQYNFSIQYDDTWQENLLTIDIEDSQTKTLGTSVCIECSEEEIDSARNLFLKLNPMKVIDKIVGSDIAGSEILDMPGIIYVNGLAVTEIDALYGYNFNKKELVNRDRAAIGSNQIKNCIATALSCTTNISIINHILVMANKETGAITPAEFDVTFSPRKNTWLKVIKELYGNKVCLSCHDPKINLTAMEKNWAVLELPWNLWYSLQRIMPLSSEVIKDKKRIIPFNKLTVSQQEFFNRGKRISDEIAGEAGLKTYPVKIFVDMEKKNETRLFNFDQTGFFVDGVAGVCHQTIKDLDMGKFVGTLLHEYVHGSCGHTDHTREFENDLTDVIASLGLSLMIERSKAKNVGLNYGLRS